jgi:hypothetical protein
LTELVEEVNVGAVPLRIERSARGIVEREEHQLENAIVIRAFWVRYASARPSRKFTEETHS